MKKYLHLLLVPVIIVLSSQIIFQTNFWQFLEKKTQDTLFHLRGEKTISEEIVIVAIDDETFTCLDIWPFPRSLYARLIKNLQKAEARQIVFDIQFTERSPDEDEDLALASAAANFGNVIFAGELQKGIQDRYTQARLISPISFLRQKTLNWGIVNISPDHDGYIRRYTLFEIFAENEPYFSIGIVALANLKQFDTEWNWQDKIRLHRKYLQVIGKEIPIIDRNRTIINFYGEPGTFPRYSFFDVIDDETFSELGIGNPIFQVNAFESLLEAEVFKDKIVLIGATAPVLQDLHHTPLTETDLMPGVEIHANFMEMVLQEDYLTIFSPLLYLLLLFLVSFIVYYIYMHLKPLWSLLLMTFLIGIYVYVVYYLFTERNLLVSAIQIPASLIIIYIVGLIHQYWKASKEKRQIKHAFMHYMAPDLVTELLKNPHKLKYGGSLQEITVLFSDIRSFTSYSEKHSPGETVTILHEYLTEMVDIIVANKGILDKFVGDEVMALYGTPIKLENAALSACKTAIEMRIKLKELQKKWKQEGKDIFEIGIGINTGQAVVGNLGSQQIFDYTAIGDTINLGARLEAINKEYATQNKIIISEYTLEKVTDLVDVKYLDEVKVVGKENPVKIYELINIKV